MSFKKLYVNFWVRNIAFFFILYPLALILGYYTAKPEDLKNLPKETAILTGVMIIAFLQIGIHNVLIYEKFLKKRQFKKYILFFSLFLFLCIAINTYTPIGLGTGDENFFENIPNTLITFIIGFGIYSIHENIILKNINYQQQLSTKEEEIKYLKAQLNPHFLFNALNNLYGSSLSNPQETPEKILSLSDLLRYQIESSQKEIVLLKDEVAYLNKYIEYEKNRNRQLQFHFETNAMNSNITIPPLLFMPFIENAIKFGNETEQTTVTMQLLLQNEKIYFSIVNNYEAFNENKAGTNTGISNTKKRLVLHFENKHQLTITFNNETCTVNLVLSLN